MCNKPQLIERLDLSNRHRARLPRTRGRALMAAGLACLLAAAALAAYNAAQDSAAGQASTAAAAQVQAVIAERQAAADPAVPSGSTAHDADEVVEIDGYTYLGVLRIPALGLELPVMADWNGDYEALKVAPTRQFGTVASGSLVIAGHNYTSHFGNLSHLMAGDEVTFTAVSGKVLRYAVDSVETVAPESVDYVQSLDGLTLYTCTYGGQSRVLVHCRPAS